MKPHLPRPGLIPFGASLALQQLRSWKQLAASPSQRQAWALRRREAIVSFAASHSRYYAGAFRGGLAASSFERLPFLDKSTLIASFDDIVTEPGVTSQSLDDYFRQPFEFTRRYRNGLLAFHTSGSTGRPAKLVWGPKEFGASTGVFLFHLRRALAARSPLPPPARRRPRVAYIGILDDYVGGNSWAYAFDGVAKVGMFSAFQPRHELCAALDDFRPDLIVTKPTILGELARLAAEGKLRHIPTLCIFAGENIGPHDAEDVRRHLGGRALNSYSMCETGPIALDACTHSEALAVYDEAIYLELVDDEQRPIREYDQPGEVVVTNLYNRVMPVIRYRTGDRAHYVNLHKRHLGATISYVEGRNTRYFVFRDANEQPQSVPEYPFWSLHVPGVLRYQVIQTGECHLLIKVQWAQGDHDRASAIDRMRQKVHRVLQGRLDPEAVTLSFESVPEIVLGKTGKLQITHPSGAVASGA